MRIERNIISPIKKITPIQKKIDMTKEKAFKGQKNTTKKLGDDNSAQ